MENKLHPLPSHFLGNFEVVGQTDDFTIIAPTAHVWEREYIGSLPGKFIFTCTHCGVEQTEDNVTETCE